MSAPRRLRRARALPLAAAALFVLGLGAWLALARSRAGAEAASAASAGPASSAATAGAGRIVSGSSPDGDLQEALAAALKAAEASQPGADMRFDWTLEAIRGVRGGIRGENEVVVEIRVR
jgi:hypothetical protein